MQYLTSRGLSLFFIVELFLNLCSRFDKRFTKLSKCYCMVGYWLGSQHWTNISIIYIGYLINFQPFANQPWGRAANGQNSNVGPALALRWHYDVGQPTLCQPFLNSSAKRSIYGHSSNNDPTLALGQQYNAGWPIITQAN